MPIGNRIWVCHRGYPSLTQNFKANFSYVYHPMDSTEIDSHWKWKLLCEPRRAHRHNQFWPAQPSPGPFQPNMGMSPEIPQFDPEFQAKLFTPFSPCGFHPNRFPVKIESFCAPRHARAWAQSVLASPAQGPFSQIWVCHRGYPSWTQKFKHNFSYVFSPCGFQPNPFLVKMQTFLGTAPRERAWAESVLASPAQGHSSQIWICHRGYPSSTHKFKPIFSDVFHHADSTQIDSW